ncbi:MAG TPA: NADP-dependent isocitrate dehydrogenase [Rhodospirillaceae bacterium]|nr:NADP-dependent isocitrate dehydrogenase [Alphaproteobacteria bacterium]HBH26375.1 NADP-dependent isocitrate dehydrogenase [Rhodospirillaceae bacterium]
MTKHTIHWTKTDEAPLLATYSFLPMVQHVARAAGITMELADISLAGRILAAFAPEQHPDALAALGDLVKTPEAIVIKLPNISASVPQLQAAIKELQGQGYAIPDYPEAPKNDAEKATQERYKKILGSAVNPVLREGNSDRRPIPAAKAYAKANPPKTAPWAKDSQTHVAHMDGGDFFAHEKSTTISAATTAKIEFADQGGAVTVLKDALPLQAGEILDATFMSVKALRAFIKEQMADAKAKGVVFSLHLKATMMKVSDPIIFGHVVEVFLEDVFAKHGALLKDLGANPNNGIADIEAKIAGHPKEAEIKADIAAALAKGPALMMVDAKKGITNLHRPNDVIIDASTPPIVRWGGQVTGPDGAEHDTKAVIPDTTYAVFHKAMVDDARASGGFDPATMGSVFNIGLMAQKAQEYGSHDKTFVAPADGTMRIVADGQTLLEHQVEAGDIWRACQTKDAPIQNWIELAVNRGRITGAPVVFWLDAARAHDAQLLQKVNARLGALDTDGVEIHILPPAEAAHFTNARVAKGQDTNAATGNVLRDHLTDMYPILELGTSAKMLSIVPLMRGGALLETGAGGSAPKHVEQLTAENHLRWDSLGEFAALAAAFDHLGRQSRNPHALLLGKALNDATTRLLGEGKSPGRKVGDLDNRGSHFYLLLYWAQALAGQTEDLRLAAAFAPLAQALAANEDKIVAELHAGAGTPADIGGYYHPDDAKAGQVMRPSATLSATLAETLAKAA